MRAGQRSVEVKRLLSWLESSGTGFKPWWRFSQIPVVPQQRVREETVFLAQAFVVLVPSSAKARVVTFESAGCRPGRLDLVMAMKPNLKDDG